MNKEEVIEVLNRYELNYSSQFIEFAIKFNSRDLLIEFCKYWKARPVGGADLSNYFTQTYKKNLGDEK